MSMMPVEMAWGVVNTNHNRRPSEQDHGLHSDHRRAFAEVRFYKWQEADTSVSIRACGATCGNGGEVLICAEDNGNTESGRSSGKL